MIEHYIRGFEEELREIRHQIHENPELGLQEFKTSALVAEKLRQWGYEVEQGLATTGVVATLKAGRRRLDARRGKADRGSGHPQA